MLCEIYLCIRIKLVIIDRVRIRSYKICHWTLLCDITESVPVELRYQCLRHKTNWLYRNLVLKFLISLVCLRVLLWINKYNILIHHLEITISGEGLQILIYGRWAMRVNHDNERVRFRPPFRKNRSEMKTQPNSTFSMFSDKRKFCLPNCWN